MRRLQSLAGSSSVRDVEGTPRDRTGLQASGQRGGLRGTPSASNWIRRGSITESIGTKDSSRAAGCRPAGTSGPGSDFSSVSHSRRASGGTQLAGKRLGLHRLEPRDRFAHTLSSEVLTLVGDVELEQGDFGFTSDEFEIPARLEISLPRIDVLLPDPLFQLCKQGVAGSIPVRSTFRRLSPPVDPKRNGRPRPTSGTAVSLPFVDHFAAMVAFPAYHGARHGERKTTTRRTPVLDLYQVTLAAAHRLRLTPASSPWPTAVLRYIVNPPNACRAGFA
jgi:hypothetical protein